jgi:predicted Zn-dependent protease
MPFLLPARRSVFALSVSALAALSLAPLQALADTPALPAATKPAAPPKEDPEIKEGREAQEEMLRSGLKLVKDPDLVARVNRIGKRLADVADVTPIDATYGSSKLVPYEYHFFIVDDPDVNAFSLPGGYIYINKGLLNYVQSDDELAGVIGHEITHASHHHVTKLEHEQSKINTQMALGVLAAFVAHVPAADAANLMQGFQLLAIEKVNGFGQNAERDADHGGMIIANKAGFNAVGMLTFMQRLARDQKMRPDMDLGIFRTHPPEKERVVNAEAELKALGVPIHPRAVTTMLRVETRNVSWGKDAQGQPIDKLASEVLLDGAVLYRTPSQERAKTAAKTLDRLLDEDIQLYDVSQRGDTILMRGEPVFTITTDDLVLPNSLATPEAVATAGYKQLRNILFREMIANAN